MGRNAGHEDPLAAVTRRLTGDDHHSMVDDVCGAVFGEHPAYDGMRDKADFRTAVSRMIRLFCETAVARRRLAPGELTTFHVAGAQWARQGIEESEMGAGMRTAVRAGWLYVTRMLADHCASAQEMQVVTALLFEQQDDFARDVERALRVGYRTELDQRLPSGLRAQATVVDHLAAGDWSDEELYEDARDRGVPVLAPLAVLVVAGPPTIEVAVLRAAATDLAGRLPRAVEGPLRMQGSPHVVVLLNEADRHEAGELREVAFEVARIHGVTLVVAGPVDRPTGFRSAYETARADLAFVPTARPQGGLVGTDELRLYALLSTVSPDARAEFARDVLGGLTKLAPAKRGELLGTFDTWLLVDGDVVRVGELLRGVSTQTVRYRLRQVEKLTGKSLKAPTDSLLLQLAIRIHRAWAEPLGDRGTPQG